MNQEYLDKVLKTIINLENAEHALCNGDINHIPSAISDVGAAIDKLKTHYVLMGGEGEE